jgi:hypothetical protein
MFQPGIWAHPALRVGPGFTLVSFLPAAKKDTASIPCASHSEKFYRYFFTAKSKKSNKFKKLKK